MTSFQSLIATICCVIIIREVFELIIPGGKMNNFVSMALGLATSFAIVQHVIKIIHGIM